MYDLISKISFNKGTKIFLILFGLLVSPYWFIFQFARDIYDNNDLPERILIALSIGTPITLIHFFLNYINFDKEYFQDTIEKKSETLFNTIVFSSVFCAMAFYVPCSLKYFNSSISQHNAIEIIIFVHLGSIVSHIIKFLSPIFKKQSKSSKPNTTQN